MTRRALFALAFAPSRKKKKKQDEELPNQTLALPKELPMAVPADTARLVFHAVPLSRKGLLSQQVRDGVKTLLSLAHGAVPIRLRAMVAGTGDLRRVPTIVSELFTEKRLPLPVLTVVQVGALPLEGAQVAIEAVSVGRKVVNPAGLAFIGVRGVSTSNPLDPVGPLAGPALAELKAALGDAEVLSITCFASALDSSAQSAFRTAFPRAAWHYVQALRAPARAFLECEAVARLAAPAPGGLEIRENAALISAPRVIFSGGQAGFHFEDSDIRLAFERLDRSLASSRSGLKRIVFVRHYTLTRSFAERVRAVDRTVFDATHPPVISEIQVEGLPGLDAAFCTDVIAIPDNS